MTSQIAMTALDSAVARRALDSHKVTGCVLHTDRGSQFRSRKLQPALTARRMLGSVGQVGSAGDNDNAAMESFFSLLQKNVLDTRTWTTRDELRVAIVTWIGTDLPPTPTANSPLQIDPHRIRTDHDLDRRPGGLT